MKLSELVYRCVKNTVHYDDRGFTYTNFIKGLYNDSPDYATNINNVYFPLNEAIARLSDTEKIPYRVEEVSVDDEGIVLLSNLSKQCKEVIDVAYGNKKIASSRYGINAIIINEKLPTSLLFNTNRKVQVEYKEDIPYFDESSYNYEIDEDTDLIDEENSFDVDLQEHGITNGMCNYIIEYTSGRLMENYDPQLSNMHITRAEQYFANLRTASQAFQQKVVHKEVSIED